LVGDLWWQLIGFVSLLIAWLAGSKGVGMVKSDGLMDGWMYVLFVSGVLFAFFCHCRVVS
jgi:hypothetical protein